MGPINIIKIVTEAITPSVLIQGSISSQGRRIKSTRNRGNFYHGATEIERENQKDNVAEFVIPEYRNYKFRNGFLE